jgi:HD superfamily phosphodiesterase
MLDRKKFHKKETGKRKEHSSMDRAYVIDTMRKNRIPEERIEHGEQVCDLALKIAARMEELQKTRLNHDDIIAGAILHDAGFVKCTGKPVSVNLLGKKEIVIPEDVLMHGMYSAELAAKMGFRREVQRITVRHELIAVTRAERSELGILPLPKDDVVPETWEEKAVMYADGLVFLALGLDLDLWNDPGAPARGFLDILKVMIGKQSKEPVTLSHPVLQRANRLNDELKGYAEPEWLT